MTPVATQPPRWTPWSAAAAAGVSAASAATDVAASAHDTAAEGGSTRPGPEVMAFHRSLDGYAPTPLVDLPDIARALRLGRVLAKCESSRLGLPAFKGLGASWAIHRALVGREPPERYTLVTATDGNHGRAVAHFARLAGARAHIFLPEAVGAAAIEAIRAEGAVVEVLALGYDETVAAAARSVDGDATRILVQDTSWDGYQQVPQWIVDGYDTLLTEVDDQLGTAPGMVLVPTGVGSLLQAVLAHYRSHPPGGAHDADPAGPTRTAVVAVEPTAAAALPPSLAAGRPVTVPTGRTLMAGLNCGTVSTLAWPLIRSGLDGVAVVDDDQAVAAAHRLAAAGVDAGPCGAASLAALQLLAADEAARRHLRMGPGTTVVLLVTEGTASNPLP